MNRKPGRQPKGDREQITVRVPRSHLELYRDKAHEAGIPLGDYIASRLAADHSLAEPDYIGRPNRGQSELPIGA